MTTTEPTVEQQACNCMCHSLARHGCPRCKTQPCVTATVESALRELREMFPGEMNLGIDRSGGDGYIGAHGHIHMRREYWTVHRRVMQTIGHGPTLTEAMAQVRAWKETQNKCS